MIELGPLCKLGTRGGVLDTTTSSARADAGRAVLGSEMASGWEEKQVPLKHSGSLQWALSSRMLSLLVHEEGIGGG